MEKILVTGAAGGIGTRLRKLMKGLYPSIRWSDIRTPGDLGADEDFVAADLTDLPVGYCLDTCHLLAAGFDIATAAGLRLAVERADECLGLSRVHLIHANDSQAALGSHRDRHAGIGEGLIGLDGFRRIVCHPKLRAKPFILETPIKKDGDDRRNLNTLKTLSARAGIKAGRVMKKR